MYVRLHYPFAAPLCYTCFHLEGYCILILILVFRWHSCLIILTILKSSKVLVVLFIKNH